MDLSFPLKEHLPESTYNALLSAARHFNASRFPQAKDLLADLLSKVSDATDTPTLLERAILTHW
jgi:hypothetical protein